MEPDRFDDVAFRILETPEPPPRPPRRRRRWAFALGATVLAAGALAAGASALTGGEKAAPAAKPHVTRSDEIGFTRSGHPCPFQRDGGGGSGASTFDDSTRY
jgi:hypothetical protein